MSTTIAPIRKTARRSSRALSLTLVALMTLPAAALVAQGAPSRIPTGVGSGGLQLQVSEPRGAFGQNTGNGFGINGTLIFRLEPNAVANWRADIGFLSYGNQTRRIPLTGTGGLIKLDLRTSNNIATFVTGPQLQIPMGAITPYAAALGGFSVFWTQSSVEGSSNDNTPFASSTNSNDVARAYGGQVGTYIRVYNGTRPVSLDLGARLLRHDDAEYLNEQRVREAFEQNRDPIPLRGRADFVSYYLGVKAVLF
jgi:hypothetical protein